jgi:hypothetical protein
MLHHFSGRIILPGEGNHGEANGFSVIAELFIGNTQSKVSLDILAIEPNHFFEGLVRAYQ